MKWLYWYAVVALLTLAVVTNGRIRWVSVAAALFWPILWFLVLVMAIEVAIAKVKRGEPH